MNHKIELEGETIHLKKSSWLGWSVVHPLKNEDGTWNWYNLLTGGNIWKLIFMIVLCFVILLAVSEYRSNMELCAKAIEYANKLNFGGLMK